ncbi:hypothetical protein [Amycolatopsis sp. MEPSY49]|uniref:hypothetical protein n=1 Tax=Amycolatopsis sp. MEPSY49 TaxID=3151600 RepID=UPI003EF63A66
MTLLWITSVWVARRLASSAGFSTDAATGSATSSSPAVGSAAPETCSTTTGAPSET